MEDFDIVSKVESQYGIVDNPFGAEVEAFEPEDSEIKKALERQGRWDLLVLYIHYTYNRQNDSWRLTSTDHFAANVSAMFENASTVIPTGYSRVCQLVAALSETDPGVLSEITWPTDPDLKRPLNDSAEKHPDLYQYLDQRESDADLSDVESEDGSECLDAPRIDSFDAVETVEEAVKLVDQLNSGSQQLLPDHCLAIAKILDREVVDGRELSSCEMILVRSVLGSDKAKYLGEVLDRFLANKGLCRYLINYYDQYALENKVDVSIMNAARVQSGQVELEESPSQLRGRFEEYNYLFTRLQEAAFKHGYTDLVVSNFFVLLALEKNCLLPVKPSVEGVAQIFSDVHSVCKTTVERIFANIVRCGKTGHYAVLARAMRDYDGMLDALGLLSLKNIGYRAELDKVVLWQNHTIS